jgi:hypothetical protein
LEHHTQYGKYCSVKSLSGGDHRWFKRSTRKKKPVTKETSKIILLLLLIIIIIIPVKRDIHIV